MKKNIIAFVVLFALMVAAGSAFAGPVDWLAEKAGYTPTDKYQSAVVEKNTAVKAAAEYQKSANRLAEVVEGQQSFMKSAGLIIALLGGAAFIGRKKIAQKILEEKTKV